MTIDIHTITGIQSHFTMAKQFLLGIAFVMPEAAEKELLEEQTYTSDLEEAGNDDNKVAEFHTHHFGK